MKRKLCLFLLLCLVNLMMTACDSQKKAERRLMQLFEIESQKESRITGKDGAPMALIPAGEFQMGSNDRAVHGARPVHTVYLDAFYMDVYEVTNAQYKKFMDATGHRPPNWNDSRSKADPPFCSYFYWLNLFLEKPADHPVIGVSWHDAAAYAKWAGKRLPTEAEWEKAARGGLEGRKYPWGDSIDESKANYHSGGPKPVGSYSPNGYGLYDMAGNAWELCMDGPDEKNRSLRGGSSGLYAPFLHVASRVLIPAADLDNPVGFRPIGFRCAGSVIP